MQLRATAAGLPQPVGGLLVDAYRVAQLMHQRVLPDEHLLERLLTAALSGLQYYAGSGQLQAPAEYRLVFREFGLAIGLHAGQRMWEAAAQSRAATSPRVRAQFQALMRYMPLGKEIDSFWRKSEHQRASTWSEHSDINGVMLATHLAPDGFLELASSD